MSSQCAPEIHPVLEQWPGRVLVSFDGSPGAGRAVEWAVREVAARGSSLRVGSSALHPTCFDRRGADDRQEQRLSRLLCELRDEHPSLVVELTAIDGDCRSDLIEEAGDADLLVLAASNQESAEAVLLGSLARRALRRSPCPVVVVRGARNGPMRRIVVGVDGSSAAGAAIDWACHEANLHRAGPLLVIHSRERDTSWAEAGCVLDLAVNECRARTGARVRGVLVEGSPASALIDASRTADIVAVGSRGSSGFKTVLFGSVALSVAEGAHCPVAVTHPALQRD
ncbi:MAG: universal stress protein [Ilumatobacteraceae bacterium]|nr:universal stress protein [Ilumatobacteraceae bacterium]